MKKRIGLVLFILVALLVALQVIKSPLFLIHYTAALYNPLQIARGYLFGSLGVSIGDIWYTVGALVAILCFLRAIIRLVKSPKRLPLLSRNVGVFISAILLVYLLFQMGWGVHYARQPLGHKWQLKEKIDNYGLATYEALLVAKLNGLSKNYSEKPFDTLNAIAVKNFKVLTNCKIANYGLSVKHSFIGWYMRRVGIEGYYNPFTGEGQVDPQLPVFLLPFVITHEMAHQAGIASESDANLLAYAICTKSADSLFNYSAYFNAWLYVHSRLKRKDTSQAKTFELQLNPISQQHLGIMRKLYQLNRNEASYYSSKAYDAYLRLQAQKDGIDSYADIIRDGWSFENSPLKSNNALLFDIY